MDIHGNCEKGYPRLQGGLHGKEMENGTGREKLCKIYKIEAGNVFISGIRYSRLPEIKSVVMSGKPPAILIQYKSVFSLGFIYKYNLSFFFERHGRLPDTSPG